MRRFTVILFLLWITSFSVSAKNNEFISLCYHDIRKDLVDDMDADSMAVGTDRLITHFAWLKSHNYSIISIQDILDAQSGKKDLPDKAVLITFDDGYISFHKYLYPLLEAFDYTAVIALVGKWLEVKPGKMVTYGDRDKKPREDFLSWEQIIEMSESGRVEIASHSYDMHHGILGNPQLNTQPTASTRKYNTLTGKYESDPEYIKRVKKDLEHNSDLIYQHTGKRPRVMVWPYGAYSWETNEIANSVGMPITLTLRDGTNNLSDVKETRRILMTENPKLTDFIYAIEHVDKKEPIRAARINLDQIYDPDPKKSDEKLGRLVERILDMQINTVYIQAFADTDGNGLADMAYFNNRHLPMRADLFNRVQWQLESRGLVQAYAYGPILSFENNKIPSLTNNPCNSSKSHLADTCLGSSFLDSKSGKIIREIYQDLGRYASMNGILFHDPLLTDHMDDPSQRSRVASVITEITNELADTLRYYRPEIKTALSTSERVLMGKNEKSYSKIFYSSITNSYDYLLINLMNNLGDSIRMIEELEKSPTEFKKTVFELQTVDPITKENLSDPVLNKQINALKEQGVVQIGYYPDNIEENHPGLNMLKSTLSLRIFPFGP